MATGYQQNKTQNKCSVDSFNCGTQVDNMMVKYEGMRILGQTLMAGCLECVDHRWECTMDID